MDNNDIVSHTGSRRDHVSVKRGVFIPAGIDLERRIRRSKEVLPSPPCWMHAFQSNSVVWRLVQSLAFGDDNILIVGVKRFRYAESDDLMMNSPVLMSTHIYEQEGRFRVMSIQTRPLSHRQEHDDKYAEPPHRVLPQQEPVQECVLLSSSSERSKLPSSDGCWASTVARLQEARRHSQGLAELELPFSVVVTASVIHGLQPLSAFFVCSVSSVVRWFVSSRLS